MFLSDAFLDDSVDSYLEQAVIGSILNHPYEFRHILSESGIRVSAFYDAQHKRVFDILTQLHAAHKVPTLALVSSHLNNADLTKKIESWMKVAPDVQNCVTYAQRLVELESWRRRFQSIEKQIQAYRTKDEADYHRATALAQNSGLDKGEHLTPKMLGEQFDKFLEDDEPDVIKLPFTQLNKLLGGGLRRKQMTLIGGWTSHGKSVVIDQILSAAAEQGYRAHLYMNEMSHEERVMRFITRDTGIPYHKIAQRQFHNGDLEKVKKAARRIPFSLTPCAGWSIEELVFDIKGREYDIIGIDILHLFDYEAEIELARISRQINRVAKQANCHVIATVHLNESRATDTRRPRPVTRDIRGSGMLKNDADNVMMIYREQDPSTGDPLNTSSAYFCKVRNGQLGRADIIFDPERFRYIEAEGRHLYAIPGRA